MPTPSRAMKSQNAVCTRPVSKTATDQIDIDTATMRLRECRSASVLIGIEPTRKSTPKAPPIAARTASLTWSVSWMSGARTLIAARSIESTTRAIPRITTIDAPPIDSARLNDMSCEPTPGSRSSGSTTSAAVRCSSCRRASSSRTVAARPAIEPLDSLMPRRSPDRSVPFPMTRRILATPDEPGRRESGGKWRAKDQVLDADRRMRQGRAEHAREEPAHLARVHRVRDLDASLRPLVQDRDEHVHVERCAELRGLGGAELDHGEPQVRVLELPPAGRGGERGLAGPVGDHPDPWQRHRLGGEHRDDARRR